MNNHKKGMLLLMAGLLAACGSTTTTTTNPGNPSGGSNGTDKLIPVVTITTPDSSNPTLPQPLNITGKFTDNVSVTRALLVIDNGPAQEIAFRPGASADFSVTITGLSAGQHTARVNAYDASNNLGFADVRFQTTSGTGGNGGTGGGGTGGGGTGGGGTGGGVDTVLPTLTLTAPTAGATVGSSFTVLGNASDNAAGVKISASLDGGAAKVQTITGVSGAFSLPFTGVAAGTHTLTVTATDGSNNVTTRTISFTVSGAGSVDTSKPVLTLLSPTAGTALTNPVLISGTATDNALGQVTYSVDGGAEQNLPVVAGVFNAGVVLPAGTHTLTVNADDTSGNRTSQTVSVTVSGGSGGGGTGDTQGPTLTLTTPQAGANVTLPLVLSGTASDPSGLGGVTYSIDGGAAVNVPVVGGAFSTTITSLPSGTHTIVVTATDAGGNATSTTVSVTVAGSGGGSGDVTGPSLTLTTPTDNQLVVGSVALSGAATDMGGVASLTYRVDSGVEQPVTLSSGNFATTIAGLAPGTHTITVTATDGSGNVTTRTITVRSVSPLVNTGSGSTFSVTKGTLGVVCLACTVTNPASVVDGDLSNYATLTNAVGLAAGTYVQVKGPSVGSGQKVGFAITDGGGNLLTLNALSGLTVRTYLNGAVQESYTAGSLADLTVLGGTGNLRGVQFTTSKAFDTVRLENNAAVGVLGSLRVYFAYLQ